QSDVYNELIRGRFLALDEIGARRRVLAEARDGDVRKQWENLRSSRQRLANLVVRGPGATNPQQYATLIEDARREKEIAERAPAERSATFRANERRADAGLDEIRLALPAGAVIVSFVRYNRIARDAATGLSGHSAAGPLKTAPSYMAFVLRGGESEPAVVRLGNAVQIDGAI